MACGPAGSLQCTDSALMASKGIPLQDAAPEHAILNTLGL